MKSIVENAKAYPDSFGEKINYLYIPLMIGVAIFFLSKSVNYFGTTLFDDAYMFIRYADNVLGGYGFVWNRGEASVYGTTSILYALFITFMRSVTNLISVSATNTLIASTFIFSCGSILCLSIIRSQLLKAGTLLQSISLYCFALLFCTPLLIHIFFGMDTTLSLFTNTLLILSVLHLIIKQPVNTNKAVFLIILCAYLAFLARPDNIIAATAFPILAIYFFIPSPNKKIITLIIGITLILCIDGLVKYLILGDPLPLSFYAKRNGFYEGYVGLHKWNPIGYLLGFIACCIPFFAFTRFKNDQLTVKLAIVFLLPALITFTYHLTMIQIMGHIGRFQFPFLPFFIVFSLICGLRCRGEKIKNIRYWITSFAILISGYAILLCLNIYVAPIYNNYVSQIEERQHIYPTTKYHFPAQKLGEEGKLPSFKAWDLMLEVGEFGKRFPQGTKIAMSEYGYIGAMAPQAIIIDTIGLHSSDIAHNGFSVDNLFAQEPDIITIPDNVYTKITSQILDNDTFKSDYEYYENVFLSGIAFNTKSPHYEELKLLFNDLWKKMYGETDKKKYLTTPL